MKEEIKEALIGSIMKWDLIAQGCGVDKAADNCPLCLYFDEGCFGDAFMEPAETDHRLMCPIAVDTDTEDCRGTEYHAISKLLPQDTLLPGAPNIPEVCDLIENFIEYMISLLPKSHKLRRLNEKNPH